MTRARRLTAATVAVVLALFPIALERCRTTCVTAAKPLTQAAPSGHACHDAAPADDNGARMDPMARACGHGDDTRAYESASLAAGKTGTVVLMPAVESLPQHRPAGVPSRRTGLPGDRQPLPRALAALTSPLRL